MAKNVPIERDEVFETARRLEAEGREVTALTMLAALGRGSLTTIYKHLAAWRQEKPLKSQSMSYEQPEQVKTAFATAWRVASEEAARETALAKEKAAEEVAEARNLFEETLVGMAKLEAERDSALSLIEELRAELAVKNDSVTKLESEAAGEKSRASELRDQLKSLQVDRDSAIKEAAEYKGQVQVLKEQNAQLLAKLDSKPGK